MARVLTIVPVPLDEVGITNRQAQLREVTLGPGITFDFVAVKASCSMFDSYHDWVLADIGILEAGFDAQKNGYDAICIDTMSDSAGGAALDGRHPGDHAGKGVPYLTALMLGNRFSVLTQWDGWINLYKKVLEYGLSPFLASIRSINVMPDVENLLGGKEEVVFPKLRDAGLQCIEDGADVICLGSTTMHQSHAYLRENLPVPVINPGPLTYKLAETMLGLGLTQSRRAYQSPSVPKQAMIRAMLDAAAPFEAAVTQVGSSAAETGEPGAGTAL